MSSVRYAANGRGAATAAGPPVSVLRRRRLGVWGPALEFFSIVVVLGATIVDAE